MLVRGLGDTLPSEDLMVDMFDTILQRQQEAVSAKDSDRVIMEISNSENSENPLWFSLRRADQITGRVILDKLGRVLNSNQAFMADGQLRVNYIHIPTPEQGGRRTDPIPNESMDQWVERKLAAKQLFSPDNAEDSMCLTRAVTVAKARGGMSKFAFQRIKQTNSVIQRNEAKKLCEMAGIDPMQPCGLDEVHRLQDALPDFRLLVFTDKRGKECVFKGPYVESNKSIHLLLHNAHFYAILFPCQAFEFKFLCEKCAVFFNHKGEHQCNGSCWRCRGPQPHDDPALPLTRCETCNHHFAGPECFQNHHTLRLAGSDFSKCEKFRFCPACERSYSMIRGQKHTCGFVFCSYCRTNVPENHLCYMQRWEEKPKKEKIKYHTIYFDIETTQCDKTEEKIMPLIINPIYWFLNVFVTHVKAFLTTTIFVQLAKQGSIFFITWTTLN